MDSNIGGLRVSKSEDGKQWQLNFVSLVPLTESAFAYLALQNLVNYLGEKMFGLVIQSTFGLPRAQRFEDSPSEQVQDFLKELDERRRQGFDKDENKGQS